MTWYRDMGRESQVAIGDHVRAVGWLHPDHAYSRGTAPPEFIARLMAFTALANESTEALSWGVFMGLHTCEFCGQAHGFMNFGVPAGNVLFVAPEMVGHYIERHGYAPPGEFIAAVLASPLPDSPEYRQAVEGFREMHLSQFKNSSF